MIVVSASVNRAVNDLTCDFRELACTPGWLSAMLF